MRLRFVLLGLAVVASGSSAVCADLDQAQTSQQLQDLHQSNFPMRAPMTSVRERAALHNGPDWAVIAPHLPDPQTATAKELETAGDVLQARRFPEDALDYYGYAVGRGGNVNELLNKIAILRMELGQVDLAHEMFARVVRIDKRNADAWNNLGVSEYLRGNYTFAAKDYKKATGLNKKSAAYHSNLGMAYFEMKDMESAQRQFALAVNLNPNIMDPASGTGSMVQVVGNKDYGGLCFQMATMFAHWQKTDEMELWLAKASEAGFDIKTAMNADPMMKPWMGAPAVVMILHNAEMLHKTSVAKSITPLGSDPNR